MSEIRTGVMETDEKTQEELRKTRAEAMEHLQDIGRGVIDLESPITVRDEPVWKLKYDFNRISGMEYVRIMKRARSDQSGIDDGQAMELFCLAVRKEMPGMDAEYIQEQLSLRDTVTVTEVAKVFFRGLRLMGVSNISRGARA